MACRQHQTEADLRGLTKVREQQRAALHACDVEIARHDSQMSQLSEATTALHTATAIKLSVRIFIINRSYHIDV